MSYREENRRRWQTVAAGWEKHADDIRRDTMPVSTWMVEAIAPQPGDTLLELAAGIGDTGFLAAELIEPGGTLTTSDLVPEMLSAAQRRAERLGVRNARFRQIDAEAIDQPAASLDGVLCRWGFMLMTDAEAALRDTRRVLKPGGRVALAAWSDPGRQPVDRAPGEELIERGLVELAPPGPGQFAWAESGMIEENLEAAGFVELRGRLGAVRDALRIGAGVVGSVARHVAARAVDGRAASTTTRSSEALAARAEPWTAEDGSLAIPARTWVAAGDRVTSAPYVLRQRRGPGPAGTARPSPSSATAPRATPTR